MSTFAPSTGKIEPGGLWWVFQELTSHLGVFWELASHLAGVLGTNQPSGGCFGNEPAIWRAF